MKLDLRTVHCELEQDMQEHIDKKLSRFTYPRDYLNDLTLTITRDGSLFNFEASLHFRWGKVTHLKVSGYEQLDGVDRLFDKIQAKVSKEKDKITDNRPTRNTGA